MLHRKTHSYLVDEMQRIQDSGKDGLKLGSRTCMQPLEGKPRTMFVEATKWFVKPPRTLFGSHELCSGSHEQRNVCGKPQNSVREATTNSVRGEALKKVLNIYEARTAFVGFRKTYKEFGRPTKTTERIREHKTFVHNRN